MTNAIAPPESPTRSAPLWRRRSVIIAAAACVVLGLAFYRFAYTPTTTLYILNDTSQTVTVGTCGSDPQTAGPSERVSIDPNRNDGKAACAIYVDDRDAAIGCLAIPTTRLRRHDTVKVSVMTRGVAENHCGN